jgi:hypothetical protein
MTHDDELRQIERARQDLLREFDGRLPETEVRERFDEIVAGFEGAPVRSFVPVLAGRAARERLRRLVSP